MVVPCFAIYINAELSLLENLSGNAMSFYGYLYSLNYEQ